ncbi:hypothetical protein D3C73_974780 [compost metagenome]
MYHFRLAADCQTSTADGASNLSAGSQTKALFCDDREVRHSCSYLLCGFTAAGISLVQRADTNRCDSPMVDRRSQQQLGACTERFHRDPDLLFHHAKISEEGSDPGK